MNEPTHDLQEVLPRLAKLEKQNRWLRQAGLALSLFFGGVFLVGLASSNDRTITAENFVLLDRSGQVRATLNLLPDGSPALGLRDKTGAPCVILTVKHDGSPGLVLSHPSGQPSLGLGVWPNGSSSLRFFDKTGTMRIEVNADSAGTPMLGLADKSGKNRAGIELDTDGTPGLFLSDAKGSPVMAAASLDTSDRIKLNFFDKNGKVVWSAP